MQPVLVRVEPATFEHLLAVGAIVRIPFVRCGRCMGSGMDDGKSCPLCVDSMVRGWLPIETTTADEAILEDQQSDGSATQGLPDRSRKRSAALPA